MCRRALLYLVVLSSFNLFSAAQKAIADFKPFAWLVGEWTGAGGGSQTGQGSGDFSFQFDLQGKILVRKSFAAYPASTGKPAYRHDDLTIIYPEGSRVRADYWDSEGHRIQYAVEVSTDGNTITFTSDAVPRYRLTYHKTGEGTLAGKFEVAPPDKPFATYLEWTARKK